MEFHSASYENYNKAHIMDILSYLYNFKIDIYQVNGEALLLSSQIYKSNIANSKEAQTIMLVLYD